MEDVEVLAHLKTELESAWKENRTLTRERDQARAEADRLEQGLIDVCSPIQAVLRGYPEEMRRHVNSNLLVRLCDSVGFLQEIARKALTEAKEVKL